MEYSGCGHYIDSMIKFSAGVANAKISAGIPPVATVAASILNNGTAITGFMKQGVDPSNYVPQAMMNVYMAIANIDLTSTRA